MIGTDNGEPRAGSPGRRPSERGFRSLIWPAVNIVMALAFAFSVVVQLNDPDPLAWMSIYSLGAVACLLELVRRGHWAFAALIGIAAFVWAARIAPRVLGHVRFADMFVAFEMKSVPIEESREMYGLLIIAVWMSVLALRDARARRRARRGASSL